MAAVAFDFGFWQAAPFPFPITILVMQTHMEDQDSTSRTAYNNLIDSEVALSQKHETSHGLRFT